MGDLLFTKTAYLYIMPYLQLASSTKMIGEKGCNKEKTREGEKKGLRNYGFGWWLRF